VWRALTDQGKAARDAAGWHGWLDALAAALDGIALGDAATRWQAVHRRLRRRVPGRGRDDRPA
jgi:hypothetical protein